MNRKLLLIKLLHTAIWLFYVIILGYLLYAGITDKINRNVVIAIGLVLLEGLVLIAFGWAYPLTKLAYRYTHDHRDGFDMFLPGWLARNNKAIYLSVFAVALMVIVFRLLGRQ